MEKNIKLKTKDGYTIYGVLTNGAKPTKRLVIFVHGLTGHKNEHQFYNAARFFPKHGCDTFRFDLYTWEKNARKLRECTVKTHAYDIETIIKYFKKTYTHITLVGHSLGGPSIVYANLENVTSIVLWDPSDMRGLKSLVVDQEKPLKQDTSKGNYIIDWGVEYILGKKMAEEFKTLAPAEAVQQVHIPVKIISAEKGNPIGSKKYFKYAHTPKELVIIKGVGHTFDELGAEDKLFSETLAWIKKYS